MVSLVPTKLLDDGTLAEAIHPFVDDAFRLFGLDGAFDVGSDFFEGLSGAVLDGVTGDDDVGGFVVDDLADGSGL